MASEIDLHVGRRLRRRRRLMGMTQQQLADMVGIRFQQIQKYECGANRMTASRLFELSNALSIPVQYFYDGLPTSVAVPAKASAANDDDDGSAASEGNPRTCARLLSAGRASAPPPAGSGQGTAGREG
jgi:transcriptional regulator with XRE-family HTH domain